MTWEELKEEAKKMEYHIGIFVNDENIQKDIIRDEYTAFHKDGSIWFDDDCGGSYMAYEQKSYEKMLAIMKALQ